MAIGKTKRFEIFKRDGFTCQYCGQRPPDVTLEVDHIDPRAGGGTDDDINLVTACFDCNRGKRDRHLGQVRPRPDADIEYLRIQQELAEAERYLKASRKLEKSQTKIIQRLEQIWFECITRDYTPSTMQWNYWLKRFSPEEIEYGIRATSGRVTVYSGPTCDRAIRYASGVMYRSEERRGQVQ